MVGSLITRSFSFVLLVGYLICSNIETLNAQLISINPEDGLLADELSEKYPDDDHIALSSEAVYTFPHSMREQKVRGLITFNETILSLTEKHAFQKFDFENGESNVKNLSAKNYKGKKLLTYGSLAKAKLKSAGIFHDDVETVSIAFNLSTRGDRISYTYEKEYFDIRYLTKAFFHTSYRCKTKTIVFEIPPSLDLELVEMNFDGFNISKTVSEKKVKKEIYKVITYKLENVVGVKNEAFSAGYARSLPHLIILAKKYELNGHKTDLFSSTADLYNWYNSLVEQVENDNSAYQELLNSLIKDAKTDQEKVENIFYWVQDNIRYIAFEDGIMGFKPAADHEVFTNKYGDCKGMANLTCEMLKAAGFDARLTWIGTRKIPYNYTIPSLAVDNHMITTLILDGKRYFLDATEKGVSFNDYAYRIQGQDLLIQDGTDYIIDTVPDFDHTHNLESSKITLALENEMLKGKGLQTFRGEKKNRLFRQVKYVPEVDREKSYKNFLSNEDKNITLNNIVEKGIEDRNSNISFSYDIEIANRTTSAANELYVSLELDNDFSGARTDEDKKEGYERVTDINFGSKYHIEKTIELTIPDNYKIDYVPDAIKFENDDFYIEGKYTIDGNIVTYTKTILVKEGIIDLKNIPAWNKAIKKMVKFYKDQIVLIKN